MSAYDAFLLVSFGGPEGPEDVMPFLRNVTAGRNIPDSRLAEVAEHYYHFGGVSPINQQCRDLLAAIRQDFAASGISLPVYWGNRNWAPYLADTVTQMAADGVTRALAVATSAYSSYSSCRQYLDDIDKARAAAGPAAPRIDKITPYYRHPGFADAFAATAAAAVASLPPSVRDDADLVFTAHSIPDAMAEASGPDGGAYPAQLAELAALIAGPAGHPPAVAGGLLQPQRPAVPAVAGPGRQRLPGGPGRRRVAGGGGGADRLRLRPHGGQVRPGPGGGADGRAAGAAVRPGADARGQRPLRGDDHRPGPAVAGQPAGRAARRPRPG